MSYMPGRLGEILAQGKVQYMKRSINKLCHYLKANSSKGVPFIIAVDGLGGAGKSFFSNKLSSYLKDCLVIKFDDFYLPESNASIIRSNFDWHRLLEQVLTPLKNNLPCNYQIFNWEKYDLGEWRKVKATKFVIIEGVTSARLELRPFLDFIIFIETSSEVRLRRGIERDGIEAIELWINDWIPREIGYLESLIH